MQFGVMVLPSGWRGTPDARVYAQVVEQAQAAEELGYDSVWLTEHHFTQYGRPGISPLATGIAMRTRRIRIGTAVYVLPIHHPLAIAADAAVVDILSGGRLDFGVGRGYQPEELLAFGVDFETCRDRHNEALEIIVQAWTRGEIEYDGRFWQIPHREFRPLPLQQPHPPIWQPIVSPVSFEESVRLKKHAIMGSYASPLEKVERSYRTWYETIDRLGADRGAFQSMCPVLVHVADTDAEARRRCQESFVWNARMFGSLIEPGRPDLKQYYADVTFDFIYDHCALIGTPDRVAGQVEWLKERGVAHLVCLMNVGDMDHEAVLDSMERFASEIIPRHRAGR
jgi:alkanesulfonate monooxygenase SsuD/methylene tetrahydromethanopterin reductase-like flavin-dependent oxidoreductase (luciferase family)